MSSEYQNELKDIDPNRAAELANAYVEELDKLNRKLMLPGRGYS